MNLLTSTPRCIRAKFAFKCTECNKELQPSQRLFQCPLRVGVGRCDGILELTKAWEVGFCDECLEPKAQREFAVEILKVKPRTKKNMEDLEMLERSRYESV